MNNKNIAILKKTMVIVIFCFVILNINHMTVYSYWYEEPEIYETENINSKWWLSRKQKEAEKQKQELKLKKKIEENNNKEFKDKNIKWLYNDLDITRFPKNEWEIIDEDNDGIGYNYYFDKDGYLLIDTITADYKIVDIKGREVDVNQQPIKYEIRQTTNTVAEETSSYITATREPSKVLIGQGVVLKKAEKIYDSNIDKNVNNYILSSNRFIKETKGTIYNEIRWKNCSSLKGNGGYVVFNNPNNNFNKITGYIATQYNTLDNDRTLCKLNVYDADLYDKYDTEHHLYEIEEIYTNDSFNNTDAIKFSFTFDRSIKSLRFEIEIEGDYKNRTCYLKDLRYGFSKYAFIEELKRKKDNEDEIEELKRLGIYIEDLWSFSALDEEGNIIEENDEEELENDNNDGRIGGIAYTKDDFDIDYETKSYEDIVRDRNTGPAFDEELKNKKEVGPSQN